MNASAKHIQFNDFARQGRKLEVPAEASSFPDGLNRLSGYLLLPDDPQGRGTVCRKPEARVASIATRAAGRDAPIAHRPGSSICENHPGRIRHWPGDFGQQVLRNSQPVPGRNLEGDSEDGAGKFSRRHKAVRRARKTLLPYAKARMLPSLEGGLYRCQKSVRKPIRCT